MSDENQSLLILDDTLEKQYKSSSPMKFFFENTRSAPIIPTNRLFFNKDAKEVCGCCDDSVYLILRDLTEMKETDTGIDKIIIDTILASRYIKDEYDQETAYCLIEDYDKIPYELKELIEWCVDFLSIDRSEYAEMKDKYIQLWSFIYDFLNIKPGYDYILMSLLEWYNIIEHGISIRCANLNKDGPYKDRKVTQERKDKIMNWINNI